ncbi:aminoacyl-tRNA hydrolase [Facilibium subflavum]|uniref:aminoacyl-tRNA hydrolase n=1 Tax=Facilibium subflavum TaxID=2219058 RepID=UPI000E65BC8D|nr:aminoacyl-tRNA hydrolase [Facilibium subflavum]
MSKIRLIAGLGNIGQEYEGTRHNAGEWFLHKLADELAIDMNLQTKFHGFVGQFIYQGQKCFLLYPNTYMNKSGLAVARLANFYKITPQEILVAHDELDLPCGQLRLKKSGGHGGHNGLRDIEAQLGSRDFYRLRIGIGHPGHQSKVVSYVLNKPSLENKIEIDQAIDRAIFYIDDIIQGNHQMVMNKLHQKK